MSNQKSFRVKIQQLGGVLTGMVMPNIGAFIAWGIITMLFIPTGWYPNEYFNTLVGPSITYLLPLLIAYTAGLNIYEKRGGVIAAIATMGMIVGSDIPMMFGAMIVGPCAAIIMKKVDDMLDGKIPQGMEMLINNFSIGILGAILMMIVRAGVSPVFNVIMATLTNGVNWIVDHNLLPFSSIFVVPAQALFLNNAINHGIMVPLGVAEVMSQGRSILFLVESNNAPWAGIMFGIWLFGKGIAKRTAPTATIIQFLGGIVEVAFPYIYMKPLLLLPIIAGSTTSLFLFQMLGGGLVGSPSPGSVFAFLAMIPKGYHMANIIGYVAGGIVSFVITAVLLKISNFPDEDEEEVDTSEGAAPIISGTVTSGIKKVIVACDAGMGSSAMGASILKSKLKKAMLLDIDVTNCAVDRLPDDVELVITHKNLVERVKAKNSSVPVVGVSDFISSGSYDGVIEMIKQPKN